MGGFFLNPPKGVIMYQYIRGTVNDKNKSIKELKKEIEDIEILIFKEKRPLALANLDKRKLHLNSVIQEKVSQYDNPLDDEDPTDKYVDDKDPIDKYIDDKDPIDKYVDDKDPIDEKIYEDPIDMAPQDEDMEYSDGLATLFEQTVREPYFDNREPDDLFGLFSDRVGKRFVEKCIKKLAAIKMINKVAQYDTMNDKIFYITLLIKNINGEDLWQRMASKEKDEISAVLEAWISSDIHKWRSMATGRPVKLGQKIMPQDILVSVDQQPFSPLVTKLGFDIEDYQDNEPSEDGVAGTENEIPEFQNDGLVAANKYKDEMKNVLYASAGRIEIFDEEMDNSFWANLMINSNKISY